MKKLLASLLAGGLLLGLSAPPSHAFSYVLKMITGDTAFTTPPGVLTTKLLFAELYTPPVPNPFEYFTPSVVSFGQTETNPQFVPVPKDNTTGIFNGKEVTLLHFDFGPGDGAGGFADGIDTFASSAALMGTLGFHNGVAFSQTNLKNGMLSIIAGPNAGLVGVSSTDPENGLPAFLIKPVYNGVTVSLWFDKISSIPAPGAAPLTLSGFIEDVPEPGTMALLIGSGVTGSLLLLRGHRRA
jgi:hypothetical protein